LLKLKKYRNGYWEEELKLLKPLTDSTKNIKEQKNRYKKLLDSFDFSEDETDEQIEPPVHSLDLNHAEEEEGEREEMKLNKFTKSKYSIAPAPVIEDFLEMNQREEFIKNEFLKK
jgi:hypothetical protein